MPKFPPPTADLNIIASAKELMFTEKQLAGFSWNLVEGETGAKEEPINFGADPNHRAETLIIFHLL